ncbi:MAG: hypothetical protein ABIR91_00530 [Candidatus Saccharimonadales bacterium]
MLNEGNNNFGSGDYHIPNNSSQPPVNPEQKKSKKNIFIAIGATGALAVGAVFGFNAMAKKGGEDNTPPSTSPTEISAPVTPGVSEAPVTPTPTPEVTPTPTPTPTETEAPVDEGPSAKSAKFKELDRIDNGTFNLLDIPERNYYLQSLQQQLFDNITEEGDGAYREDFGYLDDFETNEDSTDLYEKMPLEIANVKNTPTQIAEQILIQEHFIETKFTNDNSPLFEVEKAKKILSAYTVGQGYAKDTSNNRINENSADEKDPKRNNYYDLVNNYLIGGIEAQNTLENETNIIPEDGYIDQVTRSPRITRMNSSEPKQVITDKDGNDHTTMKLSFTVERQMPIPIPGSTEAFYSAGSGPNERINYDMEVVFIPYDAKSDAVKATGFWAVTSGFISTATK